MNLAGSGCLYITTTKPQGSEGQKGVCSPSPVQVFVKPNVKKDGLPQLVVLTKRSKVCPCMAIWWLACNILLNYNRPEIETRPFWRKILFSGEERVVVPPTQ